MPSFATSRVRIAPWLVLAEGVPVVDTDEVVPTYTLKPVIAVPTSVGYGASFHGIAALLSMLNSCAGGVCVEAEP